MRIISSFHDYYDRAQGLGYDPALIYRPQIQEQIVRVDELDPRVGDLIAKRMTDYRFEATLTVLGFCGRLYPMYLSPQFALGVEALASKPAASPVMTKLDLSSYNKEIFGEVRDSKWLRPYRARRWEVLNLQGVPASPETFRRLEAPVWLAHAAEWRWAQATRLRVYTNIRLATLDFQKHFDAYSAFQEIGMYLGSILAEADDSTRTVGSDEIIAASKGFGPESFRNAAPSLRKTRRKENRTRKKTREE